MAYQNLIGLLEDTGPSALRKLREQYPGAGPLLSSSRELGDAEAKAVPAPSQRSLLIDLIRAGVSDVKTNSDHLASAIRDRMKAISRMKFFGALVASVSGGLGALLTSLSVPERWIIITGAAAGMLGGVVGLAADQFERSPSGYRIAALDEYSKLLDVIGDVEVIGMQVERDEVVPLPDEQINAMLAKLDKYAVQINRLRRA